MSGKPLGKRVKPDVNSIGKAGIGTRMSLKLQQWTGKEPCGGCKELAAVIDKLTGTK